MKKEILILGGGISGLAAAYRMKNHANVTLLEAEEKCGGLLEFPRIFKASRSPHLLELIREVGLEKELIFSHPSAKKRYLWRQGKLTSIGRTLWPHLGRLLLEPFIPKGNGREETIEAFATRRFGKKLAHLLFDPLTLGIYGTDFGELSCEMCFPLFTEWEQRFGSLILGGLKAPRSKEEFPGSLFTLKCGMEKLIDMLNFPGIQTNSKVVLLQQIGTKWRVSTQDREYEADALFSALPAHALAHLLPDMPTIPYSSLAVVHIKLSHHAFTKCGFGYLVPSSEKEALLGMIWDSAVFPELGSGRMTAMVRPGFDPEAVVLDALERHLGWSHAPDSLEVHQIPWAIPKFLPGHALRLAEWRDRFHGLYLFGNYINGVSVEHCISSSKNVLI
jgi:oxygen-dependent protoporphyrinogen oxidase